MKRNSFLTAMLFLLAFSIHAQNDTMYVMKNGAVIYKQSIKQVDVDSLKFNLVDTLSIVKNNITLKKQSIKTSDVDSIIFYKPTILTVTDYDGNVYNTVTIGSQVWMKENLKTTHYANGTAIPLVSTNSTWDALTATSKAYCWYNDDIANKASYGALYTWAAAMNGSASSSANPSTVQGVCPTGWHLPSDAEWTLLTDYLGGASGAGVKLKETGHTHWAVFNDGATNSSGFTALPSGYRNNYGTFYLIGYHGYWWSATEGVSTNAWHRNLSSDYNNVSRYASNKEAGNSVRCLKD